jgi:predicted aconitase
MTAECNGKIVADDRLYCEVTVKLTDREKAIYDGAEGVVRQQAMEHLLAVGRFFDAEDLVPIAQVHLMADTEALGTSGVAWLESLAAHPLVTERQVRVPTITDPRGTDFAAYRQLKQDVAFVDLERRTIAAFKALGILLTDTCINYQTIFPPVFGEHVAFGDTGSGIFANSVLGARTNYEGGPSALASALTGRAPRYGYHLNECRRGSLRFRLNDRPSSLSDWGALGGLIGRQMRSYWDVPVIEGVLGSPTSDELKHFGAALASFGSTVLFHMIGVTPEAPSLEAVFQGTIPEDRPIGRIDLDAFYESYRPVDDRVDVVVFAAPQLSLTELASLARLLDGKQIAEGVALVICTSPEMKAGADRLGLSRILEDAGALLLEGVCFYQMHAREIGLANHWRHLLSNSAKLVNIIGGYGYHPTLATMESCVRSAIAGRIVP